MDAEDAKDSSVVVDMVLWLESVGGCIHRCCSSLVGFVGIVFLGLVLFGLVPVGLVPVDLTCCRSSSRLWSRLRYFT